MRSSFLAPFRADRDSPTKLLFLDAAELQSSGSLAARCGGAPQSTLTCPAIAFTITAGCSSRYLTTLVIGFSLLEAHALGKRGGGVDWAPQNPHVNIV